MNFVVTVVYVAVQRHKTMLDWFPSLFSNEEMEAETIGKIEE